MVIFIVGGTTYEESRSIALQNASNSGIRFILGGSVVLNSKRYICSHIHDLHRDAWFIEGACVSALCIEQYIIANSIESSSSLQWLHGCGGLAVG